MNVPNDGNGGGSGNGNDSLNPHLPLALHHASELQHRKDTQATILASLEELIEFPTTNTADPANPSPEDVAAFRRLVAKFQTTDYDDLIEERNCVKKCGYVFCRGVIEPSVPGGPRGNELKLVLGKSIPGQGRSVTMVPNNKIQRWCSVQCAQRCLYLKVQMSDTPWWARSNAEHKEIDVLVDEPGDEMTLCNTLNRLELSDGLGYDELEQAMAKLAIERGERDTTVPMPNITIHENPPENTASDSASASGSGPALASSSPTHEPTPEMAASSHMEIDGDSSSLEGSEPEDDPWGHERGWVEMVLLEGPE